MNANFISGCAQSSEKITFASLDRADPDYENYFGPCQIIELSHGRWRRRRIEGWLETLAPDTDGQVMALTEDRYFFRPALDGPAERIAERHPPLAAGLHGLRAVGSGIYACGGNGLIFRRDHAGWRGFAEELLRPFPLRPDNYFIGIDGPSEDQIYILAHRGVFFWDGSRAHKIEDLPKLMVVAIHVERPDAVWLCGLGGLLLRGNFHDGFTRIAHPGEQRFHSITDFDGTLYLAGDNRLWVFAGGKISRVDLGVAKHRPLRQLTRSPDALWAVGDDIFRLKSGGRWEQIPYDPPWLATPP